MDIDLVYTWCSDSEPEFRKRLNETKKKYSIPFSENEEDHRTADRNELLYSIRSVAKNLPWVRKIFIVTDRQVPEWLNIDHPKIQIVDHSEIIPAEYIPTFNATVIEMFLHKIPGLSEHFLYANDDIYVTNKTDPEFFFNDDGTPIHYVQYMDTPRSDDYLGYWNRLMKKCITMVEQDAHKHLGVYAEPGHIIDAYTKSLYAEAVEHFWDVCQQTATNQFRKNNDTQRFFISCWGYLNNRLVWRRYDPTKVARFAQVNEQKIQQFLSNPLPNMLCMNDMDYLNDEDFDGQVKLLNSLFGEKCVFEKTDFKISPRANVGIRPAFGEKTISVVFTVNENFLPFFGVTLSSLIQHISPDKNYDIVLMYENIAPDVLKVLDMMKLPDNVRLQKLNVYAFLDGIKRKYKLLKDFDSPKMIRWLKIFFPMLLKNYSKVIYLDSDLMLNCDIAELWDVDMGGKAVAGCIDMNAQDLTIPKKAHMKKIYGYDDLTDYINLGVMVWDLEALRKMNFTAKVLDLVTSLTPQAWNLYDLFNATFHQNVKILPMTYNLQYGINYKSPIYAFFEDKYCLEFNQALNEGAKIVHFTSVKPWFKVTGIAGVQWWNLAEKTPFHCMVPMTALEILIKMTTQN